MQQQKQQKKKDAYDDDDMIVSFIINKAKSYKNKKERLSYIHRIPIQRRDSPYDEAFWISIDDFISENIEDIPICIEIYLNSPQLDYDSKLETAETFLDETSGLSSNISKIKGLYKYLAITEEQKSIQSELIYKYLQTIEDTHPQKKAWIELIPNERIKSEAMYDYAPAITTSLQERKKYILKIPHIGLRCRAQYAVSKLITNIKERVEYIETILGDHEYCVEIKEDAMVEASRLFPIWQRERYIDKITIDYFKKKAWDQFILDLKRNYEIQDIVMEFICLLVDSVYSQPIQKLMNRYTIEQLHEALVYESKMSEGYSGTKMTSFTTKKEFEKIVTHERNLYSKHEKEFHEMVFSYEHIQKIPEGYFKWMSMFQFSMKEENFSNIEKRIQFISHIGQYYFRSLAMQVCANSIKNLKYREEYILSIPRYDIQSNSFYELSLNVYDVKAKEKYISKIKFADIQERAEELYEKEIKKRNRYYILLKNYIYSTFAIPQNKNPQTFDFFEYYDIPKKYIYFFLRYEMKGILKQQQQQQQKQELNKQELIRILFNLKQEEKKKKKQKQRKQEQQQSLQTQHVFDYQQDQKVTKQVFLMKPDHIIIEKNNKFFGFSLHFGVLFYRCVPGLRWEDYLLVENNHLLLIQFKTEESIVLPLLSFVSSLQQGHNYFVVEKDMTVFVVSRKALQQDNFVSQPHCQKGDDVIVYKIKSSGSYGGASSGFRATEQIRKQILLDML